MAINELFGRFNGGDIVKVIVQKFGSNKIEMCVDTDDVGAIVRQCCCSLDQAGAQNSQSPIKAAGGSVMGAVNPFMSGSRLNSKGATSLFQKGPFAVSGDGKGR